MDPATGMAVTFMFQCVFWIIGYIRADFRRHFMAILRRGTRVWETGGHPPYIYPQNGPRTKGETDPISRFDKNFSRPFGGLVAGGGQTRR